jgi:hypothetical protein
MMPVFLLVVVVLVLTSADLVGLVWDVVPFVVLAIFNCRNNNYFSCKKLKPQRMPKEFFLSIILFT